MPGGESAEFEGNDARGRSLDAAGSEGGPGMHREIPVKVAPPAVAMQLQEQRCVSIFVEISLFFSGFRSALVVVAAVAATTGGSGGVGD